MSVVLIATFAFDNNVIRQTLTNLLAQCITSNAAKLEFLAQQCDNRDSTNKLKLVARFESCDAVNEFVANFNATSVVLDNEVFFETLDLCDTPELDSLSVLL